jgi:hypothetical protein
MCILVFPAEQVGVDAGLPSFRDVWKSRQLTFWEATLVDYECNYTIPFSTVKVIVFGCNERVVSGDASEKVAGIQFDPFPSYHLVEFVDGIWNLDLLIA